MNETSTGPRYLIRWDHSRDHQLARDVVVTTHRLGELDGVFGPRLADVIDSHPLHALTLVTWFDDSQNLTLSHGDLGRFGGEEVVDMIRRGRLRLTLAGLQTHHPLLQRVISRLYGELRECQPGLRTFAESGVMRIGSPCMPPLFHCDPSPTVLWQVQGFRRVSVWPTTEPGLSRTTIEQVVSGDVNAAAAMEPALNDSGQVFDLLPGQMISIPQYMPHRIENAEGMNVTLVTKHMTRLAERQNNVHLANRSLRRLIPAAANADRVTSIAAMLKDVVVRVLYSKSQDCRLNLAPDKNFCLDPDAPGCVKPLTTVNVAKSTDEPTGVGFPLDTTNSIAPAVPEN